MSLSCYLWEVYLDYNVILLKGKRMVRKKKKGYVSYLCIQT